MSHAKQGVRIRCKKRTRKDGKSKGVMVSKRSSTLYTQIVVTKDDRHIQVQKWNYKNQLVHQSRYDFNFSSGKTLNNIQNNRKK